jgi:outer membrane protein assembly factor BamD (BamD/ComL family)
MGLINYNNGDYTKALAQYKEVVEKYPGTPEAQAALLGIKNSYVEMNSVDDYFAYTNRLGSGSNITVSEQDSMSYMAAERMYMAGNAGAVTQLQRYISAVSKRKFCFKRPILSS